MQIGGHNSPTIPRLTSYWTRAINSFNYWYIQLGLVFLAGASTGLAVIVSTYYVDNAKLLIGLIGGLSFILVTIQWAEIGILSFMALLSGLISLTWLPALSLGPISIHISDAMLILLFGLVFLRATTQLGYRLFGSPLMLPLLLFIGAFLLSAVNAIFIYGVGPNAVLRTLRVLVLWAAFIPALQLIRTEKALRRFLTGLMIFTIILLIGVLFPNRFDPLLYIEVRNAGTGTEIYSGFTRFYYAGDMLLYAMIPITVASLATIKKPNQFWRMALLGLLIYWAFKTFFRQYWLTLFVVCVLLLFLISTHERIRLLKRMMPVLAIGTLIIIFLMSTQSARLENITYVLQDRISSLLQNPFKNESSLRWRIFETRYALMQISRHPTFGLGLANSYRPPMESEANTMYSGWAARYIENGYLYIAVMMGLAGLIPFLWLCAVYLIQTVQHRHEIQDEWLRAVYIGFGLAFLGMVACNIASPTFVIGTRLVLFPIAMAVSETILRVEREKKIIKEVTHEV